MRLPLQRERLPPRWEEDAGLTAPEVLERRRLYGSNDIVERGPSGWKQLARDTARDPMIAFMVATSVLYFFLGEQVEGWTLLVSTVPLVGMDAYLHRRAQASLESLSQQLAAQARVKRDGHWQTVLARELVVGDRVEVRAGKVFPADGLLIAGQGLQAEESALTGEAYPVRKHPLTALPPGDAPVDGTHWGLAGTRLLTGMAEVRITRVGQETLYGTIAHSAERSRRARTPLQAAVNTLVFGLVLAAVGLCAALAFVRWRQGYGWVDALVSAATLAVAALPEEFPVALTFFLGVGVFRLARRRAMVRRAVSVENIGRVTLICSDKTGTMTEGRLRAVAWFPGEGIDAKQLLQAGALASRPDAGDPMDVALVELAEREHAATALERLATFPFTEERQREAAVFAEDDQLRAAVKGAPERIFSLCGLEGDVLSRWHARVSQQAMEGRKVIACAETSFPRERWQGGEPSQHLRFLGLIALEDPVRDGVREAVAACAEAGIRTVMVTGDHPGTARAVARAIGLGREGEPRIALGEALASNEVAHIDVVARALPGEKLQLIRRFQELGERVAVTGDGVNDVPALQAADVGVAMGERGTRSAKDAASIVLLDDNFRSIVGAIAEGRQLFQNLRESFAYLLLIHTPLVITAALLPLAGYPLLYLPIHVVWLELIIHPTAMLAFQAPARTDRLERLPTFRRARFFTWGELAAIELSGVLSVVLVVWGYHRALGIHYAVGHARALVMAFLVLGSAINSSLISRWRTRASWVIPLLAVVVSAVLIETPLARLFDLVRPDLDDWLVALGGASLSAVPVLLYAPGRKRRAGLTR